MGKNIHMHFVAFLNIHCFHYFLSTWGVIISLHQMTPLHVAAKRGRVESVRYVVNNEATVNIEDYDKVSIHY